jgi:hypothetical protein
MKVDGQATDKAGNTGHDSVTVKLDKTKPTILANASGTQGANGWYTSAVTVHFACDDPGALASGVQTCTSDQVLQHGDSTTGTATDVAGNGASASFGPVKVDGQKPLIDIKGVAGGGIYLLGAVPAASCVATDVGPSGIDGGCQITVTGGLANGVGKFAYTATAKDMAGNATTVTGGYSVRYAVRTGTAFWLQPINDTAHTTSKTTSVFNAGSTVPAKFRLFDANGNVVQANTAPMWLNAVRGRSTAQPVDEAAYGSLATTGDAFQWTGDHYQYNWGSPKAGTGYFWRIGVALDDGTTQTVSVALR